jgi:hypothetical protein
VISKDSNLERPRQVDFIGTQSAGRDPCPRGWNLSVAGLIANFRGKKSAKLDPDCIWSACFGCVSLMPHPPPAVQIKRGGSVG